MLGSTSGEYALCALVKLAQSTEGNMTVREIAQAERLSPKYLERVMATLRTSGYVRSIVGAKGGYSLTRPPEQIKCGEIIRLFERRAAKSPATNERQEDPDKQSVGSGINKLRRQTDAAVGNVLDRTSIADLAPTTVSERATETVRSYLADCQNGYMFHI